MAEIENGMYGPLLKVCALLNEAGAEYIVIGGYLTKVVRPLDATTDRNGAGRGWCRSGAGG